jgi:hypothetical protein
VLEEAGMIYSGRGEWGGGEVLRWTEGGSESEVDQARIDDGERNGAEQPRLRLLFTVKKSERLVPEIRVHKSERAGYQLLVYIATGLCVPG